MSTVWLLNPHALGTKGRKAATGGNAMARTAKKKTTAARKPRRTAAQKAATAKMIAANKRRSTSKRATARPAVKAAAKRRSYKRKSATAPRVVYKRNPVAKKGGLMNSVVNDYAMPMVIGAGGAIATDALWSKLKFIPLEHRTGKMRYIGKALLGVGAGVLLQKVGVPKHIALDMARGTLIVQAHAASTEFLKAKVPALGLDGYDDDELQAVIEELNGVDGLGADLAPQLEGSGMDGLGFFQPAAYDSAALSV